MAENQLVSDEVPVKKCSYAGFWIRSGAAVIDFIILIFLEGLIKKLFFSFPTYIKVKGDIENMFFDPSTFFECVKNGSYEVYCYGSVFTPGWVSFLLAVLYYAAQQSSRLQATLGMRAFGLKIIDEEEQRISFVRAAIRYAASLFSAMILGIGYLMIAFTPRKQALHDMITSVYVIRTV